MVTFSQGHRWVKTTTLPQNVIQKIIYLMQDLDEAYYENIMEVDFFQYGLQNLLKRSIGVAELKIKIDEGLIELSYMEEF